MYITTKEQTEKRRHVSMYGMLMAVANEKKKKEKWQRVDSQTLLQIPHQGEEKDELLLGKMWQMVGTNNLLTLQALKLSRSCCGGRGKIKQLNKIWGGVASGALNLCFQQILPEIKWPCHKDGGCFCSVQHFIIPSTFSFPCSYFLCSYLHLCNLFCFTNHLQWHCQQSQLVPASSCLHGISAEPFIIFTIIERNMLR